MVETSLEMVMMIVMMMVVVVVMMMVMMVVMMIVMMIMVVVMMDDGRCKITLFAFVHPFSFFSCNDLVMEIMIVEEALDIVRDCS